MANINASIEKLIGGLIVIILVTALAPELFTNIGLLGAETPAWVGTVLSAMVGIGLVLIVWKVMK